MAHDASRKFQFLGWFTQRPICSISHFCMEPSWREPDFTRNEVQHNDRIVSHKTVESPQDFEASKIVYVFETMALKILLKFLVIFGFIIINDESRYRVCSNKLIAPPI